MASKPFPFVAYRGRLSFGERSWPIRFKIAHATNGELRFLVNPMVYDQETADLSHAWHDRAQTVPFFQLEGAAGDGRTFESDHMVISGLGEFTTPKKSTLTPRLKCLKGTFRNRPTAENVAPYICFALRGFSAFPALQTTCPLGQVIMAGEYLRLRQAGFPAP